MPIGKRDDKVEVTRFAEKILYAAPQILDIPLVFIWLGDSSFGTQRAPGVVRFWIEMQKFEIESVAIKSSKFKVKTETQP